MASKASASGQGMANTAMFLHFISRYITTGAVQINTLELGIVSVELTKTAIALPRSQPVNKNRKVS